MAELKLTKSGMKHYWVEGVQMCSRKGAGSPGNLNGGKFNLENMVIQNV